MNGYIAIYNGKQLEIYADTLLEARKKAVTQFPVPLSKMGLLGVYLVEKNEEPITIDPASL